MFEDFFEQYDMQNSEEITTEQSERIKAALREKIAADISQPKNSDKEKEKYIMKSKSIRTIIIAAAIAVVGLGGVVGASAMGAFRTPDEIAVDLADKNSVSPEFAEFADEVREKEGAYASPFYEDMGEIGELVVREFNSAEFKGLYDEDLPAIVLQHIDGDGHGGVGSLIKSDGNGGYLYHGELITDEKLLAAIAEGTELYGDTFVIQY